MGIKTSGIMLALLASGGLSACATEEYVNEHIKVVSDRVDALNTKVDGVSSRVEAVNTALGGRIDQVEGQVRANSQKIDAVAASKADAKFNYNTLSTQSVYFDTAKWKLKDEAKSALSAVADKLKADNKDVYVDVVGHADPRGSANANMALAQKRANEVWRYLADQGVPLNRIHAVSMGEEKAANPKERNKEALQMARRVDVVVKG
jgi:outer membrane protein OmpA-like peptidoglycan-associated protein